MYEIYRRNYESFGLQRDGTPQPEREVAGTFLKNVANLTELDSAFRALTTAAVLANSDAEYIARDKETGAWLEPDDVVEMLQQGPVEVDEYGEELPF